MSLVSELGNLLRGSPCRLFQETTTPEFVGDAILHPDIFVTCHNLCVEALPLEVGANLRPRSRAQPRLQLVKSQ